MKNVLFKDSPIPKPSRSAIDLSYEHKLSCQIGQIIPICWYDVLPGDEFEIKNELIVKFMPMLAPLLHRVDVYTHTFFVPYRLIMRPYSNLYAGWEEFITGDPDGLYANLELPYLTLMDSTKAYFSASGLGAHFGYPVIDMATIVTQNVDLNCLPMMAYHKIYDDYYRDENLIDKITSPTGGHFFDIDLIGGDKTSEINAILYVRRRAYEKDYLRGALPTAYYGASADVELDLDIFGDSAKASYLYLADSTNQGYPLAGDYTAAGGDSFIRETGPGNAMTLKNDQIQPMSASLELLELRRAQALVRYLEAQNRGGSRYYEMILGIWGVIPDNKELQYPQYIGGGRQPVQVSSVLNQSQVLDPTAGVNDGAGGVPVTVDPQSLETGRAMAIGQKNYAKGYFKEHGVVMTLMSVLPRTSYGGARIDRYFRKADRLDFFVPQLQNIGDQEILQSEAGYDATGVDMDNVFGYAPRWSEYKFKDSIVSGDFLNSLNYWHMGTIGDTSGPGPDLNQAFIECNWQDDELLRVFANQDPVDHHLIVHVYNDVRAIRPMQLFDVPK